MPSTIITPSPSRVTSPHLLSLEDLIEQLPPRARDKVLRLRQASEDAFALMEPLQSERNEMILEGRTAEQEVRRMLMPPLHGGLGLDETSVQVQAARKRITQQQRRREELAKLIEERGARRAQIAQLVQSLEKFLIAHAGVAFTACEPVEPVLKRGETIGAAIERTRRRIRELEADQKRAASAPFPASECKAIARQQVETLAARGAPGLLGLVDERRPIEFQRDFVNGLVAGAKEVVGTVSLQLTDMLAFTAWLHKDVLLARLDAEISELVDDDAALSDQERREKLAEIDTDQLAVEREEEALITQAQQQGIDILRRQDADPRAVLELV